MITPNVTKMYSFKTLDKFSLMLLILAIILVVYICIIFTIIILISVSNQINI